MKKKVYGINGLRREISPRCMHRDVERILRDCDYHDGIYWVYYEYPNICRIVPDKRIKEAKS